MVEAAPIRVELDVFSGRPNPAWTLIGRDGRRLLDTLAALPPAHPSGDDLLGLGFRGFVVTFSDGKSPVRVVGGRVEESGSERDDSDGRVTRLLRESAPADVRAAFGQVMGD